MTQGIKLQSSLSKFASLLCLAPIVLTYTDGHALEPVELSSELICLVTAAQSSVFVTAEIARTPSQRARGLMDREGLDADAGMLFVYSESQLLSFWMYNTRIPLDIAFVDAFGTIIDIQHMQPCLSRRARHCPLYTSAAPARFALEVNFGALSAWDVQVGDLVYGSDCQTSISEAFVW